MKNLSSILHPIVLLPPIIPSTKLNKLNLYLNTIFYFVRSPSLLLVLEGSGNFQQGSVQRLDVTFGKTLFMSANTKAVVYADEISSLKVVRALSNVF